MPNITLYDDSGHRNLLLEDFGRGLAVQSNQHLIVDGGEAVLLDPGGHKVYAQASAEVSRLLESASLRHLFFSHQDPDIVAAANGWMMTTEAEAWISELWVRFVPHFGLDDLVVDRLHGIPDPGMFLTLGSCRLTVLPAHFLHSVGNFQIYDPVSKVLYSGDLGTSLGMDYTRVTDFASHVQYMEAFHRRYMGSGEILRTWVTMVRQLDVRLIAPQHGAYFEGEDVSRFLDWCAGLECGIDIFRDELRLPD